MATITEVDMKKICGNCQYQREPGQMDAGIAGMGTWCSNLQSPNFRMRVSKEDSCAMFAARGKKAPIGMRLKVKGLGLVNKVLRRKK